MLQDLAYMVVYVRDLDKCASFYRDVLGMPADDTTKGRVQFKSSGAGLVLMPKTGQARVTDGNPVHIAYHVDNLDDVYRALTTQNVKFLAQPVATEFGKQATICDPEDNVIDLIEWSLAASTPAVSNRTLVNDILQKSPEAMEVLEEHGIRICGGCIVLLNGSVRETAEYSGLSATETSELVEELNEKLSSQATSTEATG